MSLRSLPRAFVLLPLLSAAPPAAAHLDYDRNPAASACCGGHDCRPMDPEDVVWDEEAKGWRVTWESDAVFVPRESALPSPDEDFHGCGNRSRGLFGAAGPLPPGAAAELEPWRICFLVPADAMAAAYPEEGAAGRSTFSDLLSRLLSARRTAPAPLPAGAAWPGVRSSFAASEAMTDATGPSRGFPHPRLPQGADPDPRLPVPSGPPQVLPVDGGEVAAAVPAPPAAGLLLLSGAALAALRRRRNRPRERRGRPQAPTPMGQETPVPPMPQ